MSASASAAFPSSLNSARAFHPPNLRAALLPAAKKALCCIALLVAAIALRTFATGTFLIFIFFFFSEISAIGEWARLVTQLSSYPLERHLDESSYKEKWKVIFIILKYAIPMSVAAATVYPLCFVLPLSGASALTIGALTAGFTVAALREPRSPDYRAYTLLR